MESKGKLKLVLAFASISAISILFIAAEYRRRRRKQKCRGSSCYLGADRKPQYSFKRVLADNSYSAFKHLKINDKDSVNDNTWNQHPYEAEITALLENPRLEFNLRTDKMDLNMSESYVWVNSELQLTELVEALNKERVFAVDTEQHSLRSFLGFTALIQISTYEEDYLIDTIALHDSMGHLRAIFADPSICKVFHGADNDVLWLQRDFHIYVVNLFDTAKACEVLSKPQKSLAYLLEAYCGVATNKMLQREDWRQRPLSMEMVQYARTDAHYLLYIANCLIAELEQPENENSFSNDKFHFMLEANRRSNTICLQLYTKEIEASPGESAALSIFSRYNQGGSSLLSSKFEDVVRRLCAWRDLMARVHDESLRYVLADQAIIAFADKAPATPTDICDTIAQAAFSADSSLNSLIPSPSPVVCCHLDDFHYLLQDKIGKQDDIFPVIIQKCLGQNGSCPLSIFNYTLFVDCNSKLTFVSKQNGIKNSKQVARKSSRELFVQKFSCKSPVYHNCRIYANDGRLLCYCDRRKLEWYLRRDLAKLVDDNPPAIMLLFEPKGRPEDEDNDFYIQSKKNICVGCGERNHYLRYRIIPSCYRMHFPEHLKSHRSHDIVLLCVDCHEVAHASAEKYKKQIAKEFGIPLFVRKVVDLEQTQTTSGPSESATIPKDAGVSPLQLRTAAMALLRHGPRMPSKRHEELTEIVMRYYGGREISEEDLERALLVGMSPHERRRLERKKGLSFKHLKGSILPKAEQEKMTSSLATSKTLGASKVYTANGPYTAIAEESSGIEDIDLSMEKGADVDNVYLDSDSGIYGKASAEVEKNVNSDGHGVSDIENVSDVKADDNCDRSQQQNGSVDLSFTAFDGIVHPKHKSKLSLLGHGPHGKQVVDYILKEHGEDGVSQFCQRWRQVFVDAIHPRFLPAGWDIMHSGRRDFGEFSVYNPGKKVSATSES